MLNLNSTQGQAEVRAFLDLLKIGGNREAALEAFLAYFNVGKSDLANSLGYSASAVTKLIRGHLDSPSLVDKAVGYGIPRELLPDPSQARVRRRPKNLHEAV